MPYNLCNRNRIYCRNRVGSATPMVEGASTRDARRTTRRRETRQGPRRVDRIATPRRSRSYGSVAVTDCRRRTPHPCPSLSPNSAARISYDRIRAAWEWMVDVIITSSAPVSAATASISRRTFSPLPTKTSSR